MKSSNLSCNYPRGLNNKTFTVVIFVKHNTAREWKLSRFIPMVRSRVGQAYMMLKREVTNNTALLNFVVLYYPRLPKPIICGQGWELI